jgi:hypothetical protein
LTNHVTYSNISSLDHLCLNLLSITASLSPLFFPTCHTSFPIRTATRCSGLELAGPRVVATWRSSPARSRRSGAARRVGRSGSELVGPSVPAGRVAAWSSLAGLRHLLLRHCLLCSRPPTAASSAPARPPSPPLLAGRLDPVSWPTSAAQRPPSVRCDVRQQGMAVRGSTVEFCCRAQARQALAGSGNAGRGEVRFLR